jgi:MFS family permease
LISRDNFFELIWVYVIAALIEWPVMTVVAKQVKRIGWEKTMVVVYVFSGIRWSIMPLLFILNGNIIWGYLLQLYSGVLFGLGTPTTAFGLYVSLPDDQKALGQTFYGTATAIAAFLGGLVGVVLSLSISDQYLMYYCLHWIAAIFAVLSGFLLYYFKRRPSWKND